MKWPLSSATWNRPLGSASRDPAGVPSCALEGNEVIFSHALRPVSRLTVLSSSQIHPAMFERLSLVYGLFRV
jgi:hypothetical protein